MTLVGSLLKPGACLIKDASSITVCAVLKHFTKEKKGTYYKKKLQKQVHTLLLNHEVKTDSVIQFPNQSKLATAYGIINLIILKCQFGSCATQTDLCRVTHKTEVLIESIKSEDFFNLKSDIEHISLGGLDQELKQLKFLIEIKQVQGIQSSQTTVGVLLHGPPGCGKTSLCRHLAHSCRAALLAVEPTDLHKSDYGSGAESVVRLFSRAVALSEEGTVILFLDELDTLCPHPKTASLGNRQVTNSIVAELDRLHALQLPRLIVVAATNAISCVSPALRRPGRFDREILLTVPTKQQRIEILRVQIAGLKGEQEEQELPTSLAATVAGMTAGYVGADLYSLCQEAVSSAHARHTLDAQLYLQMSDFTAALHKVSPSLRKGLSCHVELKPVHWEDIGGLEDVKAEIRQCIEWPLLHPEALKRMDLSATPGLLLYGPPGCCKTTLVRAAATACNVTFLALSGAQVYSPYVGESERIVAEAFQKARALSPAILFFDEIDALVGKRSTGGSQSRVQERILATLLNEMDGIGTRLDPKTTASEAGKDQKEFQREGTIDVEHPVNSSENKGPESSIDLSRVIVIGATNRPDMLDPAILRPGRLDRLIHVPPPDLEGRNAVLKIQVSKMPTKDVDLNYLGANTEFFSGADLKNLCREAALTAIREKSCDGEPGSESMVVTQAHFNRALEFTKPSLSPEILKQYS